MRKRIYEDCRRDRWKRLEKNRTILSESYIRFYRERLVQLEDTEDQEE
ncbi:MAG: hypothetical protein ACPK85_04635 [Methanosarcina sp.]